MSLRDSTTMVYVYQRDAVASKQRRNQESYPKGESIMSTEPITPVVPPPVSVAEDQPQGASTEAVGTINPNAAKPKALPENISGGTVEVLMPASGMTGFNRIPIEKLTAFFASNPAALDMVKHDRGQDFGPCCVADCKSWAEFFVFDPENDNARLAHICFNCFDQATDGAASTTAAYFERCEAVLAEEADLPGQEGTGA